MIARLKMIAVLLMVAAATSVAGAQGAGKLPTPGESALEEWVSRNREVGVSDLTVGEMARYSEIQSVLHQERRYVYGAAGASFLLPGLGQLKTGDVGGGVLHLLGQGAIVGGTAWGFWTLLPDDIKASGLSHAQRHDIVQRYWETDMQKIAPAFGVLAGGTLLSLVHSAWASSDAYQQARANLVDGDVSFEPVAMGLGFGMRMHWK